MYQNNLSRDRILEIIESDSIAVDHWRSSVFEKPGAAGCIVATTLPPANDASAETSLNFIFSRNVFTGSASDIELHVLTRDQPPRCYQGADVDAAFLRLQQRFRDDAAAILTTKLPTSSEANKVPLLNAIAQLEPELAKGVAQTEITDRILAPYAENIMLLVSSVCEFDDSRAQRIFNKPDNLRLCCLLLVQDSTPQVAQLRTIIREQWPEFKIAYFQSIARELLSIVSPKARILKKEVSKTAAINDQCELDNLHLSLVTKADQSLLKNLRQEVTGVALPRHRGAMSNLPVRSSVGEGGIIVLSDGESLYLPAFHVTGVELPSSINELATRGDLTPEQLADYELTNGRIVELTQTPYDLLSQLTPQELELAEEKLEKLEQMSEFERLLEIGRFIEAAPYHAGISRSELLRLTLTTSEIDEFNKLGAMLKKAQGIEALLDPTPEMASSMKFWGISADRAKRSIKFDRKLEEIIARVVFLDDDTAKNRLIRGNNGYRFTNDPRPNGSALVLEVFLSAEVSSARLNLLSTPTYQAIAEVVEHFDRQIRPLTYKYNARFQEGTRFDRPVVKELVSSIRFLRSLKNFYEGFGRASGEQYLTWRQVQVGQQVMADYGLRLVNFLSLYNSDNSADQNREFEIPALN